MMKFCTQQLHATVSEKLYDFAVSYSLINKVSSVLEHWTGYKANMWLILNKCTIFECLGVSMHWTWAKLLNKN